MYNIYPLSILYFSSVKRSRHTSLTKKTNFRPKSKNEKNFVLLNKDAGSLKNDQKDQVSKDKSPSLSWKDQKVDRESTIQILNKGIKKVKMKENKYNESSKRSINKKIHYQNKSCVDSDDSWFSKMNDTPDNKRSIRETSKSKFYEISK